MQDEGTRGLLAPARLGSRPSSPHPLRHPSRPATSQGDDGSANMYAQDPASGINHPASEGSLRRVLTGRSELSRASRWNFNVPRDSGELKGKTALPRPPASEFCFQGPGSRARARGVWGGREAARRSGLPQWRWVVRSASDPVTREEGASITANLRARDSAEFENTPAFRNDITWA